MVPPGLYPLWSASSPGEPESADQNAAAGAPGAVPSDHAGQSQSKTDDAIGAESQHEEGQ